MDKADSPAATTTLSTKGQVILPKAIRERFRWTPGTRLVVEDRPDGILLRRAIPGQPTQLEDVAGMLKGKGPVLTIEEMDDAVNEMFARDHCGLYQYKIETTAAGSTRVGAPSR